MERRLAAVLAADVAGYSRLMGADEVGTLAALKMHRREIVDPAIAQHHGAVSLRPPAVMVCRDISLYVRSRYLSKALAVSRRFFLPIMPIRGLKILKKPLGVISSS